MKSAQQIIGMPVISISDGNEIGKVKNVIINAAKGTVDFFIIESGISTLSGGVVPAARVLGIGEYALTIEKQEDISNIVKIPEAIDLMQKNVTVRGTRVLSKKGSLYGEAGDIHIDSDSGYSIAGVDFIPFEKNEKTGIIPKDVIITFSERLLVVEEGFTAKLVFEQKELNISPVVSPASAAPAEETEKKNSDLSEETQPDSAVLFENQQAAYLVGKKATKSLYSSSGDLIVQMGEILTEKAIQEVKEQGRLVELLMNYEG